MAEKSGASEYVIGSKKPTQAELDGALNELLKSNNEQNPANLKDAFINKSVAQTKANPAKSKDASKPPKKPRLNSLIVAADGLSIGISMVVAVLIGVGLGVLLAKLYKPLFWLGIAFGVAAAINNVYKAYRKLLAYDDEQSSNLGD